MMHRQTTTEATPKAKARLSQSGSLLLDIVRFLAAYIVLVHHFLDLSYSRGLGNIGDFGREAVCVFFVLSGFVIRFITVTRVTNIGAYAIDRISRIYSVVGPALLFTLLCEAVARVVHPDVYRAVSRGFSWHEIPTHLFANITFLSELWGYDLIPLSNVSFWSLSFEVVYYILYALIHYKVPYRWFWVSLILLLCGPNIAFLFPIWWLGAVACDLYLLLLRRRNGEWIAGALFSFISLIFFLIRHPLLAMIRATSHERRTQWLAAALAQRVHNPDHYARLFYRGDIPWVSQLSVSFLVVGLLTASFILFGMLVLDRYHPSLPPAVTRTARLVADSTFALYLFHLPLLLLLVVVFIGHRVTSVWQAVLLLLVIPTLVVPMAMYLDRLKNVMRSTLHRFFNVAVR